MLKKTYSKSGRSCRVTFRIPAEEIPAGAENAHDAALLGEFNEWNPDRHPLKKRKDGSWSTTVSLDAEREYRFRYLFDGEHWLNDTDADREEWNQFGSKNAVLAL